MFQSLFCDRCQTYYLLERQFLIGFKYYHLVDWWRGFDQWEVTIIPKEKVELCSCNEVQRSIKMMMIWCIDNLLKVAKVGYT